MPLKANGVQKITVLVTGTSVLEVRAPHISTPVNFLRLAGSFRTLVTKKGTVYIFCSKFVFQHLTSLLLPPTDSLNNFCRAVNISPLEN